MSNDHSFQGVTPLYYLGIDQSKRSTGLVLVDQDGALIDYTLLGNAKLDNEELILWQWEGLVKFIDDNTSCVEDVKGALIEGLSFGSVGSGKDFLAGLQWYFRCQMQDGYGLFLGTVPVSMWRSKVLTKEEQKEAKALGKDGLKVACFEKLPWEVQEAFKDYVQKMGTKKGSWADLTDAYWIAQHCKKVSINK